MTAPAGERSPAARGLVLDLSQSGFAAVLDADGAETLAFSARPIGARDDLAGWLDALAREAGGDLRSLAWICAGLGPGSFTGIRMALAFAQGLALARDVPLHGFTAFEALYLSAPGAASAPANRAFAAVPANAGRFYLSRGIEDEGRLVDAAALAAAAEAEGSPTLLIPASAPAFDAVAPGFARVIAIDGAWSAGRIARHARAGKAEGRGLERPHYLQASAAEDARAAQAAPGAAAGKTTGPA